MMEMRALFLYVLQLVEKPNPRLLSMAGHPQN